MTSTKQTVRYSKLIRIFIFEQRLISWQNLVLFYVQTEATAEVSK